MVIHYHEKSVEKIRILGLEQNSRKRMKAPTVDGKQIRVASTAKSAWAQVGVQT